MTESTTLTTTGRQSLADIMNYVVPREDELRWQDVPWLTDIRDAQRLASEQNKPIFLWAMNGNPLGCT